MLNFFKGFMTTPELEKEPEINLDEAVRLIEDPDSRNLASSVADLLIKNKRYEDVLRNLKKFEGLNNGIYWFLYLGIERDGLDLEKIDLLFSYLATVNSEYVSELASKLLVLEGTPRKYIIDNAERLGVNYNEIISGWIDSKYLSALYDLIKYKNELHPALSQEVVLKLETIIKDNDSGVKAYSAELASKDARTRLEAADVQDLIEKINDPETKDLPASVAELLIIHRQGGYVFMNLGKFRDLSPQVEAAMVELVNGRNGNSEDQDREFPPSELFEHLDKFTGFSAQSLAESVSTKRNEVNLRYVIENASRLGIDLNKFFPRHYKNYDFLHNLMNNFKEEARSMLTPKIFEKIEKEISKHPKGINTSALSHFFK